MSTLPSTSQVFLPSAITRSLEQTYLNQYETYWDISTVKY